ncbi:AAA family ATPase [Microbispora cellulosiformans]|uniref:Adenylate kinase n=1 Tax=Microbispora cellulosiformans TaxID=2614688 RepID=A0A5J5K8V1_9ACTN|nr:nucleoside monophosphate kinase [Microbispora cellulosiformans]KAA9381410.1 AAA family ATPase [Microbispora cellulosiformans]
MTFGVLPAHKDRRVRPSLTCVLGPPGAGKTTFTTRAAASLGGSVFRIRHAFQNHQHVLTDDLRKTSDELGWLDDRAVEQVLRVTFEQGQFATGPYPVLLDNFPGTVDQLRLLHRLTTRHSIPLRVLELTTDDARLADRVWRRRVCPGCEPDRHAPADVRAGAEPTCGRCGGPVIVRESDRPEVNRLRLRRYQSNCRQIGSAARAWGLPYRQVDATPPPDEVYREAIRAFDWNGAEPVAFSAT